MEDSQQRIHELFDKLDALLKKQDEFSREINSLRSEINKMARESQQAKSEIETTSIESIPQDSYFTRKKSESSSGTLNPEIKSKNETKRYIATRYGQSNWEKFIGENLISKIGIAITIIGVGIGVRYSIEHELISPLTRILLGYVFGLSLMGLGIKLKNSYTNYSAILVGGSMAILYFITYAGYSFYALFPQYLAFIFMFLFTVFTVVAALSYNKEVIALTGLVGAYAVPFLLSDESGNVFILFSYMTIINGGILVIAFKKYWKTLFYSAAGLSWLIYGSWYTTSYDPIRHFSSALLFLVVFFSIFYLSFLSYKLLQKEKYNTADALVLLTNAFLFYGFGYDIIHSIPNGEQLLGLFTLANALIHFIVSYLVYRQNLSDKKLFYLVSGLVLIFITIAIPVQLEGGWVSLIWAGEAALLFWIGRTKEVPIYERLSFPILLLSFFSLMEDWQYFYFYYNPESPETRVTPLLNIQFANSVLCILAYGFIVYIQQTHHQNPAQYFFKWLTKLISICIPSVFFISLYLVFRLELNCYWSQLFTDSYLTVNPEGADSPSSFYNYDLLLFKTTWLLNYSLLFGAVLGLLNIKYLKNARLGKPNLLFNCLFILFFLGMGLPELSALRESYLKQDLAQYYERGWNHITFRYVCYAFAAFNLYICDRYFKQDFMESKYKNHFELFLYGTLLCISSYELIHIMELAHSSQSDKLGLSILWGVYSLLLIALGIWKHKKQLRVAAIVLFSITLIKLFFYDLSDLDTIAKTIVFVSLGLLLLLISFLYNKYKNIITDDNEN